MIYAIDLLLVIGPFFIMADSIITDPLGREITLHSRTWFGHILRGHPEMLAYRAEVEETIKEPDEIHYSRSAASGRQYYSRVMDNGLIISVVVDIDLFLVKTAYLTKRVKGAGLEWSRPTPSKEP